MERPWKLQRILDVVLTCSALVLVGAVVHREVGRPARVRDLSSKPEFQTNWKDFVRAGRVIYGSTAATVVLLEFSDFECPYCRRFTATLNAVQQRYGNRVGVVFLHYPLSIHRFALPAARAAECANAQGRFAAFHDVLFAKQDSLGLKPWKSYAAEAGVKDVSRFSKCEADTTTSLAITDGLQIGKDLGVRGTPTVMLNGWLYSGGTDTTRLFKAIDDLIGGREPK
jgi:protein-disulfide isomerase